MSMPAPDLATDRTSEPQASDTELPGADAPPGLGNTIAAEAPVLDATAADMSLEYWYFLSDDSPFRPT
jgi:hypothetical protein